MFHIQFIQFLTARSQEATLEDVEGTDGLEPDCFRYEAKAYPDETSSTLHPPSPAKNSRAGRSFGQHRFLTLRLGKCWEAPQEEFHFLGRGYRALYWRLPDQVTYFAEEGDGLESLKVQDLMDRLVPLEPNQDMTLLKYNQRLQLQSTTSTIILRDKSRSSAQSSVGNGSQWCQQWILPLGWLWLHLHGSSPKMRLETGLWGSSRRLPSALWSIQGAVGPRPSTR